MTKERQVVELSRYFKLIDAIKTTTTLNVARNQTGSASYAHIRLEPGCNYALEEDELFIRSLEKAKIEKRYSEQLAKELTALGIDYTEHYCKSCGGRAKRISYSAVEIMEAGAEEVSRVVIRT